ncbi:hypothetical protein HMPREF1987_01779 [Peptostreptococcaceae bacterium oral taxon 113 str. W5053]|nr:hypothetical protein HMPREF1987_01779 [Peptostreptococcaceae bacterium oral taxon 113 str. W5053]
MSILNLFIFRNYLTGIGFGDLNFGIFSSHKLHSFAGLKDILRKKLRQSSGEGV